MTIEQSQFQEISFQANYYYGSVLSGAQGGTLHIYDDEVAFRPNGFNLFDKAEKKFHIHDICGYKKGMLTILTIFLKNGTEVKLAVFGKKDEIIRALEKRRYAFYKKLGQPVPSLKLS